MVAAGTAQVGGFAMWDFQKQYHLRILKERGLRYVPLATSLPTVAVGKNNPLFFREEDWVTLDMVCKYPLLYTYSEHSTALYNKLGITPGKNVVNCRSRAGRGELLSTTDCSIGEAARLSGYDNQLYFSRLFHKMYGCAPREYRQHQQEGMQDESLFSYIGV